LKTNASCIKLGVPKDVSTMKRKAWNRKRYTNHQDIDLPEKELLWVPKAELWTIFCNDRAVVGLGRLPDLVQSDA
jgi:hypothetical protein